MPLRARRRRAGSRGALGKAGGCAARRLCSGQWRRDPSLPRPPRPRRLAWPRAPAAGAGRGPAVRPAGAAVAAAAGMGRKRTLRPAGLKAFLASLQKSDLQDVPPSELWEEAGSLCRRLQRSPADLEMVVKAMGRARHWEHLRSSLQVIQACVLVHLHRDQHEVACRLLESCPVAEKEKLVALWYEIHYHQAMKKRQATSLTPVQKHRCRKRNPPPASLCPGGVKSRNYPVEVRERLQRFAVEVTATPNQKQRAALARGTHLQPSHIYGWFANYRRRRKPWLSQAAQPGEEKWPRKEQQADGLCGPSSTEERKVLVPDPGPSVLEPPSPASTRPPARACPAQGRPAPKAVHKGVQCSLWSQELSCPCNCSASRRSLPTWPGDAQMPEAFGQTETVQEQADLQLEALVLQREQLTGLPWPALALPCSPFQECKVGTTPYLLEENQNVGETQALWVPASNLFANDIIWAATLLCDLSSGSTG